MMVIGPRENKLEIYREGTRNNMLFILLLVYRNNCTVLLLNDVPAIGSITKFMAYPTIFYNS